MNHPIRSILDLFRSREDPDREIKEDFRRTFSSLHGRRVLGFLLADMHFFDEILSSEEERVLQNYARRILVYCGAWRGANVPAIVDALLRLPIEDEQQQKRKGDMV